MPRIMRKRSGTLSGVVAYVEVKNDEGRVNASKPIKDRIKALGGRIVSRFNAKTCTHVVWKAGSDRNWAKVIKESSNSGIKVVSPLWVHVSNESRAKEEDFPQVTGNRWCQKSSYLYESPSMPSPSDMRFSSSQMETLSAAEVLSSMPKRVQRTAKRKLGQELLDAVLSPINNKKLRLRLRSPTKSTSAQGRSPSVSKCATPSSRPSTGRSSQKKNKCANNDKELSARAPSRSWVCGACTLRNQSRLRKCKMCGTCRPANETPSLPRKRVKPKKTRAKPKKTTTPKRQTPTRQNPTRQTPKRQTTKGQTPKSQTTTRQTPTRQSPTKRQSATKTQSATDQTATSRTATKRQTNKRQSATKRQTSTDQTATSRTATKSNHGQTENQPPTMRQTAASRAPFIAPPCILVSCRDAEAAGLLRDTLAASVRTFGGKHVAKVQHVARAGNSRGVTHVVVDSCRRTLKVLMGVLKGAWLLSPAWVWDSVAAGRWLPEEKYEQSNLIPAARVARERNWCAGSSNERRRFFSGHTVFVGHCVRNPPRSAVRALVEAGDGHLARTVRGASIVISQKESTRPSSALHYSVTRLFDDVMASKLPPPSQTDSACDVK